MPIGADSPNSAGLGLGYLETAPTTLLEEVNKAEAQMLVAEDTLEVNKAEAPMLVAEDTLEAAAPTLLQRMWGFFTSSKRRPCVCVRGATHTEPGLSEVSTWRL